MSRNVLKRKIQRGIQERVNNFWKGRIGRYVMQGDYLALLMEEGDSITWKSFIWDIPQGVLKFALNAGVNTLPSMDNLKRWGKRVTDRCPFCGNIGTLAHVLSNCSTALSQGRFTWRHNSVLNSLISLIRPHLKQGMTLYSDMLGHQAPNALKSESRAKWEKNAKWSKSNISFLLFFFFDRINISQKDNKWPFKCLRSWKISLHSLLNVDMSKYWR